MATLVLAILVLAILALASLAGTAVAGAGEGGAWRGRSELFWDQAKQRLVRRYVRVWDFQPERDLDFFWQARSGAPLPSETVAEVSAPGKLTWFTKGAAYYDPRAVQSVFLGTLVDGRAEGRGSLTTREGTSYEGQWKAGLMDGEGRLRMPDGDAYEGRFSGGLMNGAGRYTYANGDVLRGTFVAGRRDGVYALTRADGARFEVAWRDDSEVRRTALDPPGLVRPAVEGHPGAPPAGDLVVTIDQKANQTFAEFDDGQTYRYRAEPHGGTVDVSIDNEDFRSVWRGDGLISTQSRAGLGLAQSQKQFAPAFLLVRLPPSQKAEGVRQIRLLVESSRRSPEPFIDAIGPDFNCSNPTFLPTLLFRNAGWGPVTAMRLSYAFSNAPIPALVKEEAVGKEENVPAGKPAKIASTATFAAATGEFDRFVKVSVADSLAKLGFDSAKLPSAAYRDCLSAVDEKSSGDDKTAAADQIAREACLATLKSAKAMGGLGDVVTDEVVTTVKGTIEFDWTDAAHASHTHRHPFSMPFSLLTVEDGSKPTGEYNKLGGGAECGTFEPERRPVHPVYLPEDKAGYSLDVPLKSKAVRLGKEGIGLALAAWQSSVHDLRVEVTMRDGSVLRSQRILLDYFLPAKVAQRPK